MTAARHVFLLSLFAGCCAMAYGQGALEVNGQPVQLDIRPAGEHSIRITVKPAAYDKAFIASPALAERKDPAAVISLTTFTRPLARKVGNLDVVVDKNPLRVAVRNRDGRLVQVITFGNDGRVAFRVNAPVLGMGEGGPKPVRGQNWRTQTIQFDRRGVYDSMQPRWQADAYGSRNPVPMLVGTEGWGLFVVGPWVHVDLRSDTLGYFVPWKPEGDPAAPQNVRNQGLNQGKGLPPRDHFVPGFFDVFVFDAREPSHLMKAIAEITGPAVLPPKWALGYMQSHRLLEDDNQMRAIVDTFRAKQIPVDAVIYLGTGFTPKGWNTQQPSFTFNPEVFRREPSLFLTDMHNRNVKVVMHVVPWDRDRLKTLHGNIPPQSGETLDSSHILNYWQQHVPLVKAGVDGFWPDEGDWFNLHERMKRHQLYYQGPLSTTPDVRPWSLHRNGYLGIAKWGGWVWSGDTESSWKTLEGQVAVGVNHSLSLSPFWGSDIGGFYPNEELTGELYARWFQLGAFNASFRSHGRTWWTRLPWGWGLSDMGPKENRANPLPSEMNNQAIERVVKKYAELRYQLMPYTYTLAWQARQEGMPMMRALWLHYPQDDSAAARGDEFLWGRDLLVAPVFEKGATSRKVYLPAGRWYDWWTNESVEGGRTIVKPVDLSIMPLYVRAGAIIPVDPVRQYTAQKIDQPATLKIFPGADGAFSLYEDDGISLDYLKGNYTRTRFIWNDRKKELTIEPEERNNRPGSREFNVELVPGGAARKITYAGKKVTLSFQ